MVPGAWPSCKLESNMKQYRGLKKRNSKRGTLDPQKAPDIFPEGLSTDPRSIWPKPENHCLETPCSRRNKESWCLETPVVEETKSPGPSCVGTGTLAVSYLICSSFVVRICKQTR